jgi:hypothetical protein
MPSSHFFLKNGERFTVRAKEALDMHESLPVATYTIGFDVKSGQYFLEKVSTYL